MSSETTIRPFRVNMPDEAIAGLRRRITATRWPSQELAADRSQGVQLATIQELARVPTFTHEFNDDAAPQFYAPASRRHRAIIVPTQPMRRAYRGSGRSSWK